MFSRNRLLENISVVRETFVAVGAGFTAASVAHACEVLEFVDIRPAERCEAVRFWWFNPARHPAIRVRPVASCGRKVPKFSRDDSAEGNSRSQVVLAQMNLGELDPSRGQAARARFD